MCPNCAWNCNKCGYARTALKGRAVRRTYAGLMKLNKMGRAAPQGQEGARLIAPDAARGIVVFRRQIHFCTCICSKRSRNTHPPAIPGFLSGARALLVPALPVQCGCLRLLGVLGAARHLKEDKKGQPAKGCCPRRKGSPQHCRRQRQQPSHAR